MTSAPHAFGIRPLVAQCGSRCEMHGDLCALSFAGNQTGPTLHQQRNGLSTRAEVVSHPFDEGTGGA